MGDPGLASKFIEMQQEEFFAESKTSRPVNSYVLGLRLDRSRLLEQLKRATHPNHVFLLRAALESVERQLQT